jgi:hypothetical protein
MLFIIVCIQREALLGLLETQEVCCQQFRMAPVNYSTL